MSSVYSVEYCAMMDISRDTRSVHHHFFRASISRRISNMLSNTNTTLSNTVIYHEIDPFQVQRLSFAAPSLRTQAAGPKWPTTRTNQKSNRELRHPPANGRFPTEAPFVSNQVTLVGMCTARCDGVLVSHR